MADAYKDYYIIPVFVPHKGCPHDCVFCNQKKITGLESQNIVPADGCHTKNEITAAGVEQMIDTYLSSIKSHSRTKKPHIELSFFGGSFTAIPMQDQNELLAVAKAAKDSGRIDAIRLSTRPDYINDLILDNLKQYGADIIELGVQSMDDTVLAASERGHSSEDVRRASHLIRQAGFQLGLQMMTGLPKDNMEKDIYTANEIVKLKPDFVRIYPTLVIRSTKLENDYYQGTYVPLELYQSVGIAKEVYGIFTLAGIQIIRIGLQATEQINFGANGEIVAGPFHPAYRELVEGMLLNDMLEYGVKNFASDSKNVIIEISSKDISKLFADKKVFFNETLRVFFDKRLEIRQNSTLDRMTLRFTTDHTTRNLSLYEFLNCEKQEGFFVPI